MTPTSPAPRPCPPPRIRALFFFCVTGLRADLAVTLVGGQPQVGFSFGVFQFFSSTDRLSIR
ncbi:MAG: hypothetical protein INH41_05525 [Myxococcaceae bacterium]|nr:hypothetical protein [Myxococcaceae bacterium]MCA3011845.1 hypothetical protein [Myxococcaceae bacterium]